MSEIGRPKDQLDTPALWVDLDKLEANIDALAAHCAKAGVQWRPHTKGIKVPAIAHRALEVEPSPEGGGDFGQVLAYVTQAAPSFSLRGGTREIIRGIIARGLGLR